jgi:hypothetical protein
LPVPDIFCASCLLAIHEVDEPTTVRQNHSKKDIAGCVYKQIFSFVVLAQASPRSCLAAFSSWPIRWKDASPPCGAVTNLQRAYKSRMSPQAATDKSLHKSAPCVHASGAVLHLSIHCCTSCALL